MTFHYRESFPIGLRAAEEPINLDALIADQAGVEIGAEIVPATRTLPATIPAPRQPIYAPIPPYTFRERMVDYWTDGRGIIHTGIAAVTVVAAITMWSFIQWLIAGVAFIIGVLPTILTAVGLFIVALILTRVGGKQDDALYLKGCQQRNPGVHKVRVCNGRH